MQLKILLFGISTDLIGANSLDFELLENSSVKDFKREFQNTYPQLSQIESYAIAVNENYAADEDILQNNDVIAIIPPVSGG